MSARDNIAGKDPKRPVGPDAVVSVDVNVSLNKEFHQHDGVLQIFRRFPDSEFSSTQSTQLLGLVSTVPTDRLPRPTLVTTSRSHHLEGSPR